MIAVFRKVENPAKRETRGLLHRETGTDGSNNFVVELNIIVCFQGT